MNHHKHLIIAGVFKAGTTSLFTYLSKHKDIQASNIKETGHFVPLRYGKNIDSIGDYYRFFDNKSFDGWYMESSPGYLYGGKKIAQPLAENFDNLKIIFILRNPADRFFSFYNMMEKFYWYKFAEQFELDKEIDADKYFEISLQHAQSSEKEKEEKKDFVLNGLLDGCYAQYLEEWLACLPEENIKIIFFDDLEKDPQKVVKTVGDWIGITNEPFDNIEYEVENKTKNHKSVLVYRALSFFNHFFSSFFRKNQRLKKYLRDLYFLLNTSKKNDYKNQFSNELIQKVNLYYKAPNQSLKVLLGKLKITDLPIWLN